MRTAVRILVAILLLGASAPAWALPHITSRYDDEFRKYSKRYFGPGFDWRLFKAQAMAESGLAPDASSDAGARGIMQLLPSTFMDVQSADPRLEQIDDAECNIAAGILHDRDLWNQWGRTVDINRQRFTFGSYNAGLTTLQRAQKVAHDRDLDEWLWPSIEAVAPVVPRWRYEETLGYITRIEINLAHMDPAGRVN